MAGLTNDIDHLAHVDLLRSLNRDLLGRLALAAQTKMIPPGHLVFRVGEEVNGGYLIRSGVLAMSLAHNSSQDPQEELLPLGSFLGEHALLTPTVWQVMLYSHTPVTLMHIPRKNFLHLINAHREAIPPIRDVLSKKLHSFMGACQDILTSRPD